MSDVARFSAYRPEVHLTDAAADIIEGQGVVGFDVNAELIAEASGARPIGAIALGAPEEVITPDYLVRRVLPPDPTKPKLTMHKTPTSAGQLARATATEDMDMLPLIPKALTEQGIAAALFRPHHGLILIGGALGAALGSVFHNAQNVRRGELDPQGHLRAIGRGAGLGMDVLSSLSSLPAPIRFVYGRQVTR